MADVAALTGRYDRSSLAPSGATRGPQVPQATARDSSSSRSGSLSLVGRAHELLARLGQATQAGEEVAAHAGQ